MGSVMKRSTSANGVGTSGGSRKKDWMSKKRTTQSATVNEEMGEGWERVDMGPEVIEGDTSITRPFNVEVRVSSLDLLLLADLAARPARFA